MNPRYGFEVGSKARACQNRFDSVFEYLQGRCESVTRCLVCSSRFRLPSGHIEDMVAAANGAFSFWKYIVDRLQLCHAPQIDADAEGVVEVEEQMLLARSIPTRALARSVSGGARLKRARAFARGRERPAASSQTRLSEDALGFLQQLGVIPTQEAVPA
jgi:hypothetical protein